MISDLKHIQKKFNWRSHTKVSNHQMESRNFSAKFWLKPRWIQICSDLAGACTIVWMTGNMLFLHIGDRVLKSICVDREKTFLYPPIIHFWSNITGLLSEAWMYIDLQFSFNILCVYIYIYIYNYIYMYLSILFVWFYYFKQ